MNSLDSLNNKQKEAALHTDGPLLILAGAGSGKTSTMTHRIAHLVKDLGVDPWSILAVTFTNKAAGEMRERIETLIGQTRGMWIMTFHAACLRILHKHADKLGYGTGFSIYDPTDQKAVIKSAVKAFDLDEKKFTPNYVLATISSAKNNGVSTADFEATADVSYIQEKLSELYTEYERVLKKNNAMDFDDLLLNTAKLFEKFPDALEEYQNRFKYIMVDEYQDTNLTQYKFVKMLAEKHGNVCVVGDDDQCIYEWRGANIKNILNFEKDFKGAKVIKLEQNYRSHANILKGANSVIAHNSSRKAKELWTEAADGEKIRFVLTPDERYEAQFAAKEINNAVSGGDRNYRDFAILYRTNAQSRTFEEALSAWSIPYQLVGGLRYYDRKEIKDIMSYMRLVIDPNDDVAFTRIINEPRRGVGAKTLAKLTAYAAARGESLFAILSDESVINSLPSKPSTALKKLVGLLDGLHSDMRGKISGLYDAVLVRSGYLHELEAAATIEADGRIENLLEFKSVILEEEQTNPDITLTEFMEKLALISDIDNHDRSENAVTLMTLHSAKGLEFPVVFMPGMEEGLFPGSRAMDHPGKIEEERRLCYVGMTRARELLYMIRATSRTMYGRFEYTLESRFLREIDKTTINGANNISADTTKYFHTPMGAEDGFAEAEVIRPFDQLAKIKREVRREVKREARRSSYDENALRRNASRDTVQRQSSGDLVRVHSADNTEYNKGDRVRHVKFGEGLVIDADARTVTVIFDSEGKKKLAKGMAPLEKV